MTLRNCNFLVHGLIHTQQSPTILKIKRSTIEDMDFLPLQYSYFPKKEAFDFRKAASIQPWDLVKYMSLVLLCAEEIESKKPHKNTDIVFSYRSNQETTFFFIGCVYMI